MIQLHELDRIRTEGNFVHISNPHFIIEIVAKLFELYHK